MNVKRIGQLGEASREWTGLVWGQRGQRRGEKSPGAPTDELAGPSTMFWWVLWADGQATSLMVGIRLFYASILGFQKLRSHPGWPLALRCNSIPLAPQFTVLFLGGFLCLFPWMSSR